MELNIAENYPLKNCTSFRVGGPADRLITVNTKEELEEALKYPRPMILGNGTNVLFSDAGYRGTVIKFGPELSKISIRGTTVKAGAGALFATVAKTASAKGLTGLEFACGIPGSVGGAVYMNAGAYDGSVSDVINKVDSIPELKQYGLSYRHSSFMEERAIILGASFKLERGDQDEINAKIADLTKRRTTKQPLAYPSAGSFFKRPEGYFAGKLIEDAGLKGRTVGGAQISELHAGFMINIGGATCADIIELMHIVQDEVFDRFGVRLEPEVRIIEEQGQL